MPETLLIFPAGMPASLSQQALARARGVRVVGASSLAFDPARSAYDDWEYLPYVTEPGFADAFDAVLHRRGVTAVFTPHYIVARAVRERLAATGPGVSLIEGETLLDQQAAYRDLRARAAQVSACEPDWPGAKPPLGAAERVGLIRLINCIPGMCNDEKILALTDVVRMCPAGDVVEIGSWWGKSAALLALLAQRYGIGRVLCVDPWRRDCMGQSATLLDESSGLLDPEEAFEIFQINLAPLARGALNYLRMTGHEAAQLYRAGLQVTTDVFGAARYEGKVALLHVDGNHKYEDAAQDVADWSGHMAPGGWLVIDDYLWPFGDGPQRVGDEFLAARAADIALSFVSGTALFAKLTG